MSILVDFLSTFWENFKRGIITFFTTPNYSSDIYKSYLAESRIITNRSDQLVRELTQTLFPKVTRIQTTVVPKKRRRIKV